MQRRNVPYNSKRELYVAGAIAAGSFLTSFDASAMAVALPVSRTALATTLDAAGWLLPVELLATTSLPMFFGRLGDLPGHKPVYLAGCSHGIRSLYHCDKRMHSADPESSDGAGSAMIAATAPAPLVRHNCSGGRGRVLGLRTSLMCPGLIPGSAFQSDWRQL